MNNRRVAAMLFVILGILVGDLAVLFPPAAQLEARNTTVMTHTEKPAVVCGALSCSGNNPVKGGHAGHTGGGVIFIGS